MRIDQAGNVGIGTTSPNAKLHIGPSTLVSGYTPDRSTLAISDTTNGGQLIIRGQSPRIWFDATAGGNAELFLDGSKLNILSGAPTSTGSSRFYIKADGNVGIGTTSPDQKLQIEFANSDTSFSGGSGGNWGSEGIRIENTINTVNTMAMLHFRNNDADVHIASIRQGANDSDLGFFFEGSQKVTFKKDGNVGIGNTSPTAKLHVAGTGLFTGLVSGITPVNAANFVTKAYVDGSGGGTGPFLPLAGGTLTGDLTVDGASITIDTDTAGNSLVWKESDGTTVAGQLRGYANRGDIYLYSAGTKTTELSASTDSFIPALHIGGTSAATGGVLQVTGNATFCRKCWCWNITCIFILSRYS